MEIPTDADNLDGLNYIAGKRIDQVNKMAELGTRIAHVDGGVPNLRITIPALREQYLGQLIYFFEKACGISGYILDVNPFNQPGVEDYKRNMFALLEKPGYASDPRPTPIPYTTKLGSTAELFSCLSPYTLHSTLYILYTTLPSISPAVRPLIG